MYEISHYPVEYTHNSIMYEISHYPVEYTHNSIIYEISHYPVNTHIIVLCMNITLSSRIHT